MVSSVNEIKTKYDLTDLKRRLTERKYFDHSEIEKIRKYTPLDSAPARVPLLERLRKKYGVPTALPSEDTLVLDDRDGGNRKKINDIYESAKKLKERYRSALENTEENSIYFKTADNLVGRLERFIGKGNFSSLKMADEIVKALSNTVLKNFCNPALVPALDSFMTECKFKKIELRTGKKVEDDDFDYITDNYLKIKVTSPDRHNTIISKKHDAYAFGCYDPDEEEFFRKIIPGEYAVGCWKE